MIPGDRNIKAMLLLTVLNDDYLGGHRWSSKTIEFYSIENCESAAKKIRDDLSKIRPRLVFFCGMLSFIDLGDSYICGVETRGSFTSDQAIWATN